jgi:hypothetical protein
MNVSGESTVLSSWKDIAKYLGKGVRTVQRWERQFGLPVRRPIGASQKSAVLLYRGDVDAWLATRFAARAIRREEASRREKASRATRSTLLEGIKTARELRLANQALTEQISESIRLLTERCDLLTHRSLRVRGSLSHVALAVSQAAELAVSQDFPVAPELLPNSTPTVSAGIV